MYKIIRTKLEKKENFNQQPKRPTKSIQKDEQNRFRVECRQNTMYENFKLCYTLSHKNAILIATLPPISNRRHSEHSGD